MTIDQFDGFVARDPDGCWLWTGAVAGSGYGTFYLIDRLVSAHRIAWTRAHGPIPSGMSVCHHCDRKVCVRPDHLFLGTTLDNMRDRDRKGRAARGERHPIARLTNEAVRQIRAEYAGSRASIVALAERHGVYDTTVAQIVKRKTWKHIA